jgi:hypothetical protein
MNKSVSEFNYMAMHDEIRLAYDGQEAYIITKDQLFSAPYDIACSGILYGYTNRLLEFKLNEEELKWALRMAPFVMSMKG